MTLQGRKKLTRFKISSPSYISKHMCSFFFLCLFHAKIHGNCKTNWTLAIIHGTSIILKIISAKISIVLPEDSIVIL